MFSKRTHWNQTVNRLSALLARKRSGGARILDLTLSNPTEAGLVCDPTVLAELSDPRSLRYEPEPLGALAAREAVARDYGRRGALVDPDRVLLTASTSEAYAILFKLLCDPGDNVLVPRPSYPLFEFLVTLEGVERRAYLLDYDGRWHLSVDSFSQQTDVRTRAVVVVNPNNPTGSFLDEAEAAALLDLCAATGLAVVSDEVFADFAFAPDPGRRVTLAGDGPALTFSLGGLSKACGLPQLKLGWIVVSGPPELRRQALERLEVIADTFLSVNTPVQRAAPGLLARVTELQSPIHDRLTGNLSTLRAAVMRRPEVSLLDAQGGWYAVLRLPATVREEARVLALLAERDVLVHPGYFFDFPQEAFVVVSLLPRPEDFAAGVWRLLESV